VNKFAHILFLVIFAGSVSPLMAQQEDFALLMRRSPDYGGYVTPLSGAQTTGLYRLVEISAEPREGFEFIYWLGDVTDPGNSSTTVLLDSPKIVVAIFERSEIANLAPSDALGVSGGRAFSSGNLTSSRFVYPQSLVSPPPASAPRKSPVYYNIIFPEDNEPDPDVPEPATLTLFAMGALMLAKRKRRK
jgi:hypothetical protein